MPLQDSTEMGRKDENKAYQQVLEKKMQSALIDTAEPGEEGKHEKKPGSRFRQDPAFG